MVASLRTIEDLGLTQYPKEYVKEVIDERTGSIHDAIPWNSLIGNIQAPKTQRHLSNYNL